MLGQRDLAAEDRLKALFPKAVSRLDKELDSADARIGLQAADRVLKATGKYSHPVQDDRPKAEEVIQRFMEGVSVEHEQKTTVTAVRAGVREDVPE